jgi:hypothetical protein
MTTLSDTSSNSSNSDRTAAAALTAQEKKPNDALEILATEGLEMNEAVKQPDVELPEEANEAIEEGPNQVEMGYGLAALFALGGGEHRAKREFLSPRRPHNESRSEERAEVTNVRSPRRNTAACPIGHVPRVLVPTVFRAAERITPSDEVRVRSEATFERSESTFLVERSERILFFSRSEVLVGYFSSRACEARELSYLRQKSENFT